MNSARRPGAGGGACTRAERRGERSSREGSHLTTSDVATREVEPNQLHDRRRRRRAQDRRQRPHGAVRRHHLPLATVTPDGVVCAQILHRLDLVASESWQRLMRTRRSAEQRLSIYLPDAIFTEMTG